MMTMVVDGDDDDDGDDDQCVCVCVSEEGRGEEKEILRGGCAEKTRTPLRTWGKILNGNPLCLGSAPFLLKSD